MRVTDTSLFRLFVARLGENKSTLDAALATLADGKRVRQAGDDPSGARASLELRGQLVRNQGYLRSAATSRSTLETVDDVLGAAFNLVTEARTKTLAGASSTQVSANDVIATEIDDLRASLLSLANTQQQGRSLFAGTETLTVAFDSAGVYGGNADESRAPIGPDSTVGTTLDGQNVFQGAGDLFATLDDISTALRADDSAALEPLLDDLNAELDHLLQARTDVGTRLQAIDRATGLLEQEQLRLQRDVSGIEDADLAEAVVRLNAAAVSRDALSQAAVRVLGRSLFDFLG